ncbi:MAG: ferritin family protein [Nitrospirota bacterium]
MQFFRCQICGDVYIGTTAPSSCPYCGAKARYLVPTEQWVDENLTVTGLSEISRQNLERALQLEIDNTPFYRDASARAKTMKLQGVFKGLSKVENEHASVIRKILKCEFPPPDPANSTATDDDGENLRNAHGREIEASKFYAKSSVQASEPRVKKVFLALSEIEADHIKLENELLKEGGGGGVFRGTSS